MNFFTFTKLRRTLLLSAVMAVVAVWLAGCGGGGGSKPAGLVGHWVLYEGATYNKPEDIELFKDGTGLVDKSSITWKVENKRLVLLSALKGLSCNYKVSGYELVLTYDDEDSATFVKKENLEEYEKKKEEEERKEEEQRIKKLSGYFTDSRNGQKYRTVKIGGKTWMAQNLNYQTGTSWCYDNADSNCVKYGRLYDWNTAKTVCPTGWHLPSREEWGELGQAVGGEKITCDNGTIDWYGAGEKLKSKIGWDEGHDVESNGTDDYGFSALPSGFRDIDDGGKFCCLGDEEMVDEGVWWEASERDKSEAYFYHMTYNEDNKSLFDLLEFYDNKKNGYSVRCIAD